MGENWNLVAVPLSPLSNSVSSVFGAVTSYTNYVQWYDPLIADYKVVSTGEPGKALVISTTFCRRDRLFCAWKTNTGSRQRL